MKFYINEKVESLTIYLYEWWRLFGVVFWCASNSQAGFLQFDINWLLKRCPHFQKASSFRYRFQGMLLVLKCDESIFQIGVRFGTLQQAWRRQCAIAARTITAHITKSEHTRMNLYSTKSPNLPNSFAIALACVSDGILSDVLKKNRTGENLETDIVKVGIVTNKKLVPWKFEFAVRMGFT